MYHKELSSPGKWDIGSRKAAADAAAATTRCMALASCEREADEDGPRAVAGPRAGAVAGAGPVELLAAAALPRPPTLSVANAAGLYQSS